MAISSVASLGTGASGVSSTTLTVTTGSAVPTTGAGIIVISSDNIGSTDGDNSDVTSVNDGTNAWTKLGERTNSNGAAAAGVTCSVWMLSRPAVELATSSTITITFASAIVDKVASAWEFNMTVDTLVKESGPVVPDDVDATTGFGSVTSDALSSLERLYFRGLAKEVNSTAAMTPTTGFTGITALRSRNDASAVIVRGEFKIATSAGSETSNPTLAVSGDTAGVFVSLREGAVPGGSAAGPLIGGKLVNRSILLGRLAA